MLAGEDKKGVGKTGKCRRKVREEEGENKEVKTKERKV